MEVVVTLGIFALFVGFLGLIPQLLGLSLDSASETRSAQIARQIVEDLMPPALRPSGNPTGDSESEDPIPQSQRGRIVTVESGDEPTVVTPNIAEAGRHVVVYNLDGKAVPETDPQASLKADIILKPEEGRGGFCQVEIQLRPLRAPPTEAPYRFLTKITVKRKEPAPAP